MLGGLKGWKMLLKVVPGWIIYYVGEKEANLLSPEGDLLTVDKSHGGYYSLELHRHGNLGKRKIVAFPKDAVRYLQELIGWKENNWRGR